MHEVLQSTSSVTTGQYFVLQKSLMKLRIYFAFLLNEQTQTRTKPGEFAKPQLAGRYFSSISLAS